MQVKEAGLSVGGGGGLDQVDRGAPGLEEQFGFIASSPDEVALVKGAMK